MRLVVLPQVEVDGSPGHKGKEQDREDDDAAGTIKEQVGEAEGFALGSDLGIDSPEILVLLGKRAVLSQLIAIGTVDLAALVFPLVDTVASELSYNLIRQSSFAVFLDLVKGFVLSHRLNVERCSDGSLLWSDGGLETTSMVEVDCGSSGPDRPSRRSQELPISRRCLIKVVAFSVI